MDAWKAMLAASVVLVLFAVVVSVGGIPLEGPAALAVFAVVAVIAGVGYALTKRSYQYGQRLGEGLREED
ncbi:MAG: hypothetical protein ABEI98_08900 [Halorhabdus sp.]